MVRLKKKGSNSVRTDPQLDLKTSLQQLSCLSTYISSAFYGNFFFLISDVGVGIRESEDPIYATLLL
jgi:hypothetical protein